MKLQSVQLLCFNKSCVSKRRGFDRRSNKWFNKQHLLFLLQAAASCRESFANTSISNRLLVQESRCIVPRSVMIHPSFSLSDLQISFLSLASQLFYHVTIYISPKGACLYILFLSIPQGCLDFSILKVSNLILIFGGGGILYVFLQNSMRINHV